MKLWSMLTSNYFINVGVVSWILAQVIKTILTLISLNKFVPERLVGSGGMPSSHSAFTVSIAVAMAKKMGFASPEFALAMAFALVVMYDAMGVRRAAGEQAKVLNRMMFEFSDFPWFFNINKDNKKAPKKEINQDDSERLEKQEVESEENKERPKELKEFLGHTPLEVVGGCILGIIVALLMPIK